MSTDDYGLPRMILGNHPDRFYGAIGRIVCVCAVLEQQLQTLRHALAQSGQGRYSHEPVAVQARSAYALAGQLPAEDGARVRDFLTQATEAFERRNAIAHSAFPAQSSGRQLGHRPTRDRTVTDGTAQWTEMDPDDLTEFIVELSRLVLEFNEVFARSQRPFGTDA